MNRNIPNILSVSRILICPILFFIKENDLLFITVIIVIGLTDVFDGYLARRYNFQSRLGAQLDSIGDFVFFVSLLIYMLLYKRLVLIQSRELLFVTVSIKCIPLLIGLIKYTKIIFLHTILNKISGVILLLGIIAIIMFELSIILKIILLIIIIAGLEESIILLIVEKPNENTQSIFDITRKTIT